MKRRWIRKKINSEMKQEYVISSETIIVLPDYDEHGFLRSLICNKDGISKAGLSPFNLIDTNLRFRGSSLRGALDGSKAILDKQNVNPVIVDKEQDIILFPCRSPYREDCVWLSLRHIKRYEKAAASHTRVRLSNDSTIILDISVHTFTKKIQRAYELRYKMQTQMLQFEGKVMETGTRYHLMKDVAGVNYEVDGLVEQRS